MEVLLVETVQAPHQLQGELAENVHDVLRLPAALLPLPRPRIVSRVRLRRPGAGFEDAPAAPPVREDRIPLVGRQAVAVVGRGRVVPPRIEPARDHVRPPTHLYLLQLQRARFREQLLVELADDAVQNAQSVLLRLGQVVALRVVVHDVRKHDRHVLVFLVVKLVPDLPAHVHLGHVHRQNVLHENFDRVLRELGLALLLLQLLLPTEKGNA